jgi:hypothetical protein
MAVYVDNAIHRWRGQLWCHIFSPDIEELHAFMSTIGSRREWFQDPERMPKVSWPHYDANEKRRDAAVRAGAIPLDRRRTVVMSRIVKHLYAGGTLEDPRFDPLGVLRARDSQAAEELEIWLRAETGWSGMPVFA